MIKAKYSGIIVKSKLSKNKFNYNEVKGKKVMIDFKLKKILSDVQKRTSKPGDLISKVNCKDKLKNYRMNGKLLTVQTFSQDDSEVILYVY